MNRRDWRYAQKMKSGITHIIRQAAKAGFRVDSVVLNAHDRKLIRNANPTRSYMVAGVAMEEDQEHRFAPYCKEFVLVTNAPQDGGEMAKEIQGVEFPEGFEWPEPKE